MQFSHLVIGLFALSFPGMPQEEATEAQWNPLFDGRTLAGWTQRNGTATYSVEDGAIVGRTSEGSPNSFLCSDRDYADFELRFEVRVDARLNSGVQIRSRTRGGPQGRVNGPQVEVEASGSQGAEAGYLYAEAAGGWMTPEDVRTPHRRFVDDDWNRYRVLALGANIKVWINDELVSDLDHDGMFASHPRGFIGLQVHSIPREAGPYEVRWRGLEIRELGDGAVAEKLAGGMAFTEGPVWLPAQRELVFSDIPASKLMRWSEREGLGVFRESEKANGNLLDLQGRLLSCQHAARNIVRTEEDGSLTVLIDRFEGKRFNSPNDVAVQSDGTLWFTDPPWGLEGQTEGRELAGNWVFRLDPATGEAAAVLRGLSMPNGLALSPDETRLYVADTGGHRSHPDPERRAGPATVSAYEIRGARLAEQPVWRIETRCDGMCVDENGWIYATGSRGVTIWTPEGRAAGAIAVAEPPANVCFGGDDFTTLFITARTSLYTIDWHVAGAKPKAATW